MTAMQTYLEKRQPAQKMARFYRMAVMPNLFGEWTLLREWGRIGQGGAGADGLVRGREPGRRGSGHTRSLQASARLLGRALATGDVQVIA